ncbi:hypothetical protein Pcac1_g27315 [Phytophthora cactorum]|nr:hypothetical protein Pcac1_g27315 [Phytophthora cactorum]
MSTSMSRPLDFHRGISDEDVDDLDVDSLDIDDDGPRQTEYKQTGSARVAQVTKMKLPEDPHTVAPSPGLEEASAPDSSFLFAPSGRRRRRKIW